MPGPAHFDAHADADERGRPPYPSALWERLRALRLLGPGVRVVELGAGTGQATGPMLDAGATVLAVEPGERLVARLRRRWPQAEVLVATAEDADLPPASFDLAVAATAVHWFDLGVVLPNVHRALVPGGHLAVWRNAYGDPEATVTPFRERVARIVARRGPRPPRPAPGELDDAGWAELLRGGGLFPVVHRERFRWAVDLDAGQVRDLFTTFSDWTPGEAEEAAQAVRDLGGTVREHYVTPLLVLRRLA
ncbi:class I SAM-dependent methyltransferase [Cellulosimicrobium cellulans]|uniref:class I SAM-dependent methyltransferase n=1 Tax=Cellulosimicrobium cellulans TaxID=1710 RepID=UPI00130EEA82|nr:class I SAM-dependent methyltransferase [Cellulosimicrobium cellulans]